MAIAMLSPQISSSERLLLGVLQRVLQRVLQCVAVCCSVLQCVVVCCTALQVHERGGRLDVETAYFFMGKAVAACAADCVAACCRMLLCVAE